MPYTEHGHWYGGGEPTQPGPRLVARCGGPGMCEECARQAGTEWLTALTDPEETQAGTAMATPSEDGMTSVIHIAGPDITVGPLLRQRCGWCGAVLVDYDLTRIAVPTGQDPRPGIWSVGALVEVDGSASWVVPHVDGEQLPANACAQLDPEVTV